MANSVDRKQLNISINLDFKRRRNSRNIETLTRLHTFIIGETWLQNHCYRQSRVKKIERESCPSLSGSGASHSISILLSRFCRWSYASHYVRHYAKARFSHVSRTIPCPLNCISMWFPNIYHVLTCIHYCRSTVRSMAHSQSSNGKNIPNTL